MNTTLGRGLRPKLRLGLGLRLGLRLGLPVSLPRRACWTLGLSLAGALVSGLVSGLVMAASCTLNTTSAIFGSYDNTLNETAVATFSGTCSKGGGADPDMTGATVTLSTGTSNSFASRQMAKGTDRLNYNLYTSAARTTIWGDGTGGSGTVAALVVQGNGKFLNNNSSRNFSIAAYGRIPAGLDAVPGAYSDTITVTMSY